MRILILGPSGQIGYQLAVNAVDCTEVVTAGRTEADIIIDPLDNSALEKLFTHLQPDIVINAIAYTAVDKAESDQELAYQLNADLPAALADHCEKLNCLLIHYSTDFVFDGTNNSPLKETAATNPLSVYGKSKLAGEKAIQIATCPSLILRTSWVYGQRGSNFLLTMLRLAREKETLTVVNDQLGSPSFSDDIALASIELCKLYQRNPAFVIANKGLYHLTCSGQTSWYGFAKAIFDSARKYESLRLKELLAISTHEHPTAAQRPAYSVLDCQRIKDVFAIKLPDWNDSLQNCLNRYYQ